MKYTQEQLASIEKVKTVFADYMERTLESDLVWSDKVGYVLLRGINLTQTGFDFQPLILEDGSQLCSNFLVELCYEIIERENFHCDPREATFSQQKKIRDELQPYMDQLPEYEYLIDEIFTPLSWKID